MLREAQMSVKQAFINKIRVLHLPRTRFIFFAREPNRNCHHVKTYETSSSFAQADHSFNRSQSHVRRLVRE